jgi:hypothetical protein
MRRPYPTDLSDAEWLFIEPYLPTPKAPGRPRVHSLREILNAIYHIVVNQNYHPGNAGLPFYFDILLPFLLIVLEIIYRVSGAGSDTGRVPRVA